MNDEISKRYECPRCGIFWGDRALRWVETTRIQEDESQKYTPRIVDTCPKVCPHFYTQLPVIRLQEGFDRNPKTGLYTLMVRRKPNPRFRLTPEEPQYILVWEGKPFAKTDRGRKIAERLTLTSPYTPGSRKDQAFRGPIFPTDEDKLKQAPATRVQPHFIFQSELPVQILCSCKRKDEIE